MAGIPIEQGTSLIQQFGQLRQSLTPIEAEIAELNAKHRELIEAARFIGSDLVGRVVTVTKINEVDVDYTIGSYGVQNELQSGALMSRGLRRYDGSKNRYHLQTWFQNPSTATGLVEGIDLPRTSLILKPERKLDRLKVALYWVRLVDTDGNPLVTLDIHPE